MKRPISRIFSALMLLPLLLGIAGCNTDSKAPDTSFNIDVREVYADAAKIVVTPAIKTMTFYFDVIEKSEYVSDEDIISRDRKRFESMAAESGKSLSHVINAQLSVGVSTKIVEGLKPQTSYYAYAYTLDGSGLAGEINAKVEFITHESGNVHSVFKFSIEDVTSSGAIVTVESRKEGVLFYTSVLSSGEFKRCGANAEGIAKYFAEFIQKEMEKTQESVEEVMDRMSHKDRNVYYYQTLFPESDYYIYAISVNRQGEVLVAPEYVSFRTEPAGETGSADFDVTFDQINASSAVLLITPTDPTMSYYYGVFPVEDVDKFNTGEDFMHDFIQSSGYLFSMMLLQGEDEGTFTDLTPDKEYYVVAFGATEATYITELYKKKFKTQIGFPLDEFRVEININSVTSTEIVCEMFPNSTDYRYIYDPMPSYFYPSGKKLTKEYMQEYVGTLIQFYMSMKPQETLEDILKFYLTGSGNNRITFRNLAPDIDYYVWAAAIDMEGNLLSDYEMVKVRTKKEVMGKGTVKLTLGDVFDGNKVKELLPEKFYFAENRAVAFFNAALDQVSGEWIYCVFKGDLSKFDDDQCITNLLDKGTFLKPEVNKFLSYLDWETDYTILAMAKDKNGDWGPLTRHAVNISRSHDLAPISDFPLDFVINAPAARTIQKMEE